MKRSSAASGTIGYSDQELFSQKGNGLVMSIGNGQADGASTPIVECSNTLNRMHDATAICATESGKGYWMPSDTSGTLRAEGENRPSRPSNVICVHGSQDPIFNTEHANAVNRNNGLENVVAAFMGGQGAKARSIGYSEEHSPTIKSSPSGGNTIPTVVCYENHAQDSRVRLIDDCAPQLNAKAGTGGNNLPLVQAIALAENTIGRQPQNGGNGDGFSEELAYTQNTTGVMGVATKAVIESPGGVGIDPYNMELTGDVNPTLGVNCGLSTGRNGVLQQGEGAPGIYCRATDQGNAECLKDLSPTITEAAGTSGNYKPFVGTAASVRRLLPVECERLMGFPDNWTRISWKGKPEEDCPDSPRYKACGNSMCVNVMRWIGLRIEQVSKGEKK